MACVCSKPLQGLLRNPVIKIMAARSNIIQYWQQCCYHFVASRKHGTSELPQEHGLPVQHQWQARCILKTPALRKASTSISTGNSWKLKLFIILHCKDLLFTDETAECGLSLQRNRQHRQRRSERLVLAASGEVRKYLLADVC